MPIILIQAVIGVLPFVRRNSMTESMRGILRYRIQNRYHWAVSLMESNYLHRDEGAVEYFLLNEQTKLMSSAWFLLVIQS